MSTSSAVRRVPENLFYALLKLQDKIDRMTTLTTRPTQVRLDESMFEDFKRRVHDRSDAEPRSLT